MIWLGITIVEMAISCVVAGWMVVDILSHRYCSWVEPAVLILIFPPFMLGLGLKQLIQGVGHYNWNHGR